MLIPRMLTHEYYCDQCNERFAEDEAIYLPEWGGYNLYSFVAYGPGWQCALEGDRVFCSTDCMFAHLTEAVAKAQQEDN